MEKKVSTSCADMLMIEEKKMVKRRTTSQSLSRSFSYRLLPSSRSTVGRCRILTKGSTLSRKTCQQIVACCVERCSEAVSLMKELFADKCGNEIVTDGTKPAESGVAVSREGQPSSFLLEFRPRVRSSTRLVMVRSSVNISFKCGRTISNWSLDDPTPAVALGSLPTLLVRSARAFSSF